MPPQLCPMVKPSAMKELEAKLEEATNLCYDSVVGRSSRPERVDYTASIRKITNISTTGELFGAEVLVTMTYLVSRRDVFNYAIDPEAWQPEWVPAALEAQNGASHDVNMTALNSRIEASDNGHGRRVLKAKLIWLIRGDFVESLELQAFPFDVQCFNVKLHSKSDPAVEYVCVPDRKGPSGVRETWQNSEWSLLGSACTASHSCNGTLDVFVTVKANRIALSYIARIMTVMAVMLLLSLSVFAIDVDEFGDRLAAGFTILLTITAYSLVIDGCLPTLGYLTFIDMLNLCCYVVVATVVFQIFGMEVAYMGGDSADEDARRAKKREMDEMFVYLDVLIICGIYVITFAYVWVKLIPAQLRLKWDQPRPGANALVMAHIQNVGEEDAETVILQTPSKAPKLSDAAQSIGRAKTRVNNPMVTENPIADEE